jgi:hypothetical protein
MTPNIGLSDKGKSTETAKETSGFQEPGKKRQE